MFISEYAFRNANMHSNCITYNKVLDVPNELCLVQFQHRNEYAIHIMELVWTKRTNGIFNSFTNFETCIQLNDESFAHFNIIIISNANDTRNSLKWLSLISIYICMCAHWLVKRTFISNTIQRQQHNTRSKWQENCLFEIFCLLE